MEKKLNDIKYLIEKLSRRIDNALTSSSISNLERDLMLDLLKQAYVAIEELNAKPVEQVVSPVEPPVIEVKQPEPTTSLLIQQPSVEEYNIKETPFSQPQTVIEQPVFEEPAIIETPILQPQSVFEQPVYKEPVFEETPQSQPEPATQQPVFEKPVSDETPAEQPLPVFQQPVFIEPVIEKNPEPQPQPIVHHTKDYTEKAHAPVADLFGNPMISDKFKKETPTLNDMIVSIKGDNSLAHQMQLKPISDLRTAIGINEKFQFVNDLFDGQIEKYNEAIMNLNNCSSGNEAKWLLKDLKNQYNWKEENEAYNRIQTFVNRRYL